MSQHAHQPETSATAPKLETAVQYLKGVGPDRAGLLAKLGVHTVGDLLFFFPRDYQDLSDLRSVEELEEDALLSVRGEVVDLDLQSLSGGRSLVGVLIRDGAEHLRGMWFNQPHVLERFRVGAKVMFSGRPRLRGGRWEMNHPKVQWLDDEQEDPEGPKLVPVYPLTEGLKAGAIRRMMRHALESYAPAVPDWFDEAYRRDHNLEPIAKALHKVHLPADQQELDAARRRLIYDEFFLLELALAVNRRRLADRGRAPVLETTPRIDSRIRRLLPFKPTPGQERAIADVVRDLAGDKPMNRLLQGDVGSGKTAVAVYGLLVAVANGCQAVLMAPTEVLARQHWATLEGYLAHSRVRRLLLTGGTSTTKRRETLAAIRSGEVDLIVGTHAVIQDDVEFARLGFVVIDEQHKFGVRQRGRFRNRTEGPHILVMTATPIPRTLAMTLFGDLDLSTITDLPPGRQKSRTYVVAPESGPRVWDFVRRKLREGRQAYVICPLIEQSESLDLRSAEALFRELKGGELAEFTLDLLHGRMEVGRKQAAMDAFRARRTQVLVSTTVVEVGVDVPSATLMVVEHAERFGLSQLHQLRGRISRGVHPGYCFLFDRSRNEQLRNRLKILTETSDGFRIAEADFELRGPGELLGTRQHGLPVLRIGDLKRDQKLLEEARHDAFALVRENPGLRESRFDPLRRSLGERYAEVLDLAEVG